jgi:small subunit ribosomal protein S12
VLTKNQTLGNLLCKYVYKRKFKRLPLRGGPHRGCVTFYIVTRKPKKPNSANRSVIGAIIRRGHALYSHISGEFGHELQKFSTFIIQGARVRDLPQVHYRGVRGNADLLYVATRVTSRSKYGRPNPQKKNLKKVPTKTKKVRRDKQIAASSAKRV